MTGILKFWAKCVAEGFEQGHLTLDIIEGICILITITIAVVSWRDKKKAKKELKQAEEESTRERCAKKIAAWMFVFVFFVFTVFVAPYLQYEHIEAKEKEFTATTNELRREIQEIRSQKEWEEATTAATLRNISARSDETHVATQTATPEATVEAINKIVDRTQIATRPVLSPIWGDDGSILLANKGLGPAIIRDQTVFVDDKSMPKGTKGYDRTIEALGLAPNSALIHYFDDGAALATTDPNTPMFAMNRLSQRPLFEAAALKIKFALIYDSLGGERFTNVIQHP